jgi:hypothetical protein
MSEREATLARAAAVDEECESPLAVQNSVQAQVAKTALFAAGNCAGSRKNRQETIFSK